MSGIAIAPGGNRVYIASADGGVWRSDNAGASWRPTMDGFDVDPAGSLATSNTCGAIGFLQQMMEREEVLASLAATVALDDLLRDGIAFIIERLGLMLQEAATYEGPEVAAMRTAIKAVLTVTTPTRKEVH